MESRERGLIDWQNYNGGSKERGSVWFNFFSVFFLWDPAIIFPVGWLIFLTGKVSIFILVYKKAYITGLRVPKFYSIRVILILRIYK